MVLNTSNLYPQVYWGLREAVLNREYDTFRLKGGRASLKSSICATLTIELMLRYSWVCAAVFMKEKTRLRGGAFNLYREVITRMGLDNYFKFSVSPMTITYKPTGQYIMFSGLDDPFKTKGFSTGDPKKFFAVTHWEELDQFHGIGEIDTALESLIRGGMPFSWCFQCYNPPENRNNWCNRDSLISVPGRLVMHTDYRQIPPEWLGEPFYKKMRALRARSEREYRWRYLGESTGTGGSVFENIREKAISDDDIELFRLRGSMYNGQDWGYFPDPAAFVRWHYDVKTDSLYCVAERRKNKSTYAREARAIIDSRFNDTDTVLDSARGGEMYDAFANEGVLVRNMYKGRKEQLSREFGIQWLQTRKNIYIDPKRTPNTFEEFMGYEYQKDLKTGEFLNKVITFNDHFIDASRYALSPYYQVYGDVN